MAIQEPYIDLKPETLAFIADFAKMEAARAIETLDSSVNPISPIRITDDPKIRWFDEIDLQPSRARDRSEIFPEDYHHPGYIPGVDDWGKYCRENGLDPDDGRIIGAKIAHMNGVQI